MKVWVVTVTEDGLGGSYKYVRGVYSTYERAKKEKDRFNECETFFISIDEFDLEG